MQGKNLVAEAEGWLDRLYIAAEGAGLRDEDRRKAIEVAGMLREVELAVRKTAGKAPFVLVDAAAGKTYVGLLAAKLVLEPRRRNAKVISIEWESRRVEQSRLAAERLQCTLPLEFLDGNAGDPQCWPARPDLVTALHACGPATDAIIERATEVEAKRLLIVPCCTGKSVAAAARAEVAADRHHIPHQAPVRRRFIQACVDAERTWRLEAAGYQTEVVEFVAPTVTPHNLLWRAVRVREPNRMEAARRSLQSFLDSSA